ncbi:MAG: hypothetical protein EBT03_08945, partial [Betaproteobacteria bacterium]|nr:hypothetical protein [Betaproteobacteria bacterium]
GRPPKKKEEIPDPYSSLPPSPIPPDAMFGGDEDDGEDEIVAPRPLFRPATPSPSPTMMRQQQQAVQQQTADEFETYLSTLEFDGNQHSVSLHRDEPEYDSETRVRIRGYLEKFTRPVTFEEIRTKHGGGKYKLIVHGPGFNGRPTIKANRVIEIAGEPILPKNKASNGSSTSIPSAVENLVKEAISSSDRQVERLAEENKDLKALVMAQMSKNDSGLKEMLIHLANPQHAQQAQQQLIEERRIVEMRMQAEREERRREQEAAERRHQQAMEMLRLQNEKQLEMMRLEQDRVRTEARLQAEQQQRQFELQMRAMEKMDAEKAQRAIEYNSFMQENANRQMLAMQEANKQTIEAMKAVDSMKMSWIEKQLSTKPPDPIEQMIKLKQATDILSGKDDGGGEAKETWEKIADYAKDSVPGLIAAIGLMRGGSAPAQLPPAQPQVMPGTVAVIDDVDDLDEPPLRRTQRRRRRALPPTQTTQPAPAPAAAAPVPAPATVANDLTEFVTPSEGMEIEQQLEVLVKSIDLALQRDLSADQIVATVLSKFPKPTLDLLTQVDADTVVNLLEARAPSDWRINSLSGQMRVREVHAKLVAQA